MLQNLWKNSRFVIVVLVFVFHDYYFFNFRAALMVIMFSRFFSCEWNCLRRRASKFRKVFALVAVIAPESGIQRCIQWFGIWNPLWYEIQNPEGWNPESKGLMIQNPDAGTRNLEAGIRNPGPSWILLQPYGDCNPSFNSCFVSTIIYLHNSRSSCLHDFSISRFNHNFRKNSSLMCACAVFLFIKYFYCICRASHIPSATW